MKRTWGAVLAGLALLLFASVASATPIAAGMTVVPSSFANYLASGVTLLASTGDVVVTPVTGDYSGVLVENVYARDAAGHLDFVLQYKQTADAAPPDPISRVSAAHFFNTAWAVYYSTTGNILSAPVATRKTPNTADESAAGSVIGFNYAIGNRIMINQETDLLIIRTGATLFQKTGSMGTLDGAGTAALAFEPIVPEPAAILLLGLVSTGLAVFGRRRMKHQL